MYDMDKIAIIIPVHNRRDVTLGCLKQLREINRTGFETEIVLIDDGSTDGTSEAVARDYPETTIIKGDGNLWWSGGINKGFEYALKHHFDFVYTINDDIIFFPNTLQFLYDTLKKTEDAACSSAFLNDKGLIACAGFGVKGLFSKYICTMSGDNPKDYRGKILESETLSSKSCLIPRQLIQDTGFYDYKNLPQCYCDWDYFLRAKKKEYSLLVNMDSHIVSEGSDKNFHLFILHNSVKDILKSYGNIKYGHHIPQLYGFYARGKPLIKGHLGFVFRTLPYFFWTILRIILPKKTLKKVIIKTGRVVD